MSLISPQNPRFSISPPVSAVHCCSWFRRTHCQVLGIWEQLQLPGFPSQGLQHPLVLGCCKSITTRCPQPESAHREHLLLMGTEQNPQGEGNRTGKTKAEAEIPNLWCVEDGLSGRLKLKQQGGGKKTNGKLIFSENVFNVHKA